MKQLTKVKIINWHYFWNETFDIQPIVFLTGVNGSGKSTLIDALQVVLLGDTTGRYFNKAAMDKSARTLKGYLRGELGDTTDGGFKYLRNGRFTSYIVLEYYDDLNKKPFSMGIVLDTFEDGSEEHHFFYLDDKIPNNEFVINNVPMDYKALLKYFTEFNPGAFEFFQSNRQYQEFLRKQFGGLKEKYFSLLKKATSFSPITDITTFITEYVCDAQANIELDALQDNILQYKRLEEEAINIEKRVARLEEVGDLYSKFKENSDNLLVSQYIIERCNLEQSYEKIKLKNNEIEKCEARIKEIEIELKDFEQNLNDIRDRKEKIIMDKATNDSFKIAESYKKEKKDIELKIGEIEANVDYVKKSLLHYANSFLNVSNQLTSNLKDINENMLDEESVEEIEILKSDAISVKNACLAFKEEFIDHIENLTRESVTDFRNVLVTFKQTVSALAVSLSRTISNYEKNIRAMKDQEQNMKRGAKPYDSLLVIIKKNLENELESRYGKHIPVEIFADLIDINDLSWSNAIEGVLALNRFALFVAPKYYDVAYSILRNLLQDYNYYKTSLIDQEKIIERDFICEPDSLAEEINTSHEGARAYTNFLIGRLHKSKDALEARRSGNGITKECDIYRNYSLSRINPRIYKEAFIGRQLDDRLIKEKGTQVYEMVQNLNHYRKLKEFIDDANSLDVFTNGEVDNLFTLLQKSSDLPGLIKTLNYIEDELHSSSSTLTSSLDKRLDALEEDLASIEKSKSDDILEKGNLINKIAQLKDVELVELQNNIKVMEDSLNEKYEESLIKEKALPLFEEAKNEHTTFEIYSEYNVKLSRAQYYTQESRTSLFRARRDYCQDYGLSYETENLDNKIYENELVDFRDVKLPDYKTKIEDSYNKATKQFKDDFIFKLRGAICDVEDQIENLNVALKQSSFGRDLYRFTVKPSSVYRRYYDMLRDDSILETGQDDSDFINKYKDVMEDLFRQIVDVGNGEKNSMLLDNISKFTDYRSYLDFDLIVYNKDTGDEQRLSKMIKKKSGGETQTPFYIAVLASFAQLYHVNDEGEIGNTVRLIIFDEAFSKMDRTRMTEAVKLLRKFNLQVILSAPYDKIPDISPLVDETLIVLHDKNRSCVRLFEKEQQ